jgi:hypothetical protein
VAFAFLSLWAVWLFRKAFVDSGLGDGDDAADSQKRPLRFLDLAVNLGLSAFEVPPKYSQSG